jgi:VCBS repeat-containing protein
MLRSADDWDGQHFSLRADDAAPNAEKIFVSIDDHHSSGPTATIPDAHLLFNGDFERAGSDLIVHDDNKSVIVPGYFAGDKRATLLSPEGAALQPHVVDALAGPMAPGQYAQAGGAQANAQAVGRVAAASGNATIVRNGVAIAAHTGDAVMKGDVLQTGTGAIGVTFNDGSTVNLTANARLVVNEFIYDPNGKANSEILDLVQGSLTFISGHVAHTGDMKIGTPVATMGIRGTVGGVSEATDGSVHFYVSQSATGAVILDSNGTVIANVTQNGPLIVVHPVGPLQVLAEEVQKSPAELAAEVAALQHIVNVQAVGQQIIQQFLQPNQQNQNNPQSHGTDHTQIQIDIPKSAILPDNLDIGGATGNAIVTVTTTTTDTQDNTVAETHQQITVPIPPDLPTTTANLPQVAATAPAHLVEATADDPGINTATSTLTLSTSNGVATYDAGALLADGWSDGGNGNYTKAGVYGTAALNINNNTLSYLLDNNKADSLGAGDTPTETFTIPVTDTVSTTTANVTFTIEGRNDAPHINTTADLSFESGLSGWQTDGQVSQVTGGTDGTHAGFLQSGAISESDLETFLDIPQGTLAAINTGPADANLNPTYGSAIATDIFLQAGQTLTFDWRFSTNDYFPWGDFAFFSASVDLGNATAEKLADVFLIGDYGDSGWQTGTFIAPISGTYHIGFGVSNAGDNAVSSSLLLDNVSGGSAQPVNITEDASGTGTETAMQPVTFSDPEVAQTHVVTPPVFVLSDYSGGQLGSLNAQLTADTVNGLNGQVTLTYTVDDSEIQFLAAGQQIHELYNISVDDGHGGVTVVPVPVVITGVNDAPVPMPGTATVSEEGLPGGIADSTGNTDTTDSPTAVGTIAATDAESDALTFTLGEPTTPLTSNGMPVTWEGMGTQLLTGSAGSDTVITIAINQHSGAYTVTLASPVDHADGSVEDVKTIDVPVNVSDGQATTATTLAVDIEDDRPVAAPYVQNVTAGISSPLVNLVVVLDISGSMDAAVSGTDGTRLELAQAALHSLLTRTDVQINQVMAVSFSSLATVNQNQGSYWTDAASADSFIQNMQPGGGTYYDHALSAVTDNWGAGPGAADQTVVYFISDGQPEGNHQADTAAWESFLTTHGVDASYAIGIGTSITDSDLTPIAWKPDNPDFPPIVLSEPTGLDSTLQNGVPPAEVHNILADNPSVGFGADGGHILSVEVDGVTYTWNGTDTITKSGLAGGIIMASMFAVDTALGGHFEFHFAADGIHAAGDWSYVQPDQVAQPSQDIFHYVLTNADGGQTGGDITIGVTADNYAPALDASHMVASDVPNTDDTVVTGLAVSDWDANANDTFTLSATADHGTLTFDNSIQNTEISGNGGSAPTVTATVDSLNALFNAGVTYAPEGSPGNDKVVMTVDDQHGGHDNLTFVFNVNEPQSGQVALQGTAGKDVIFATGADDTLTGNGNSDTFVFAADAAGSHHITDFSLIDDFLQFHHSQFANIDAVLASAASDGAGDTVITDAAGTVTLDGVDHAQFQMIDHSHILIV